MDKNYPINSRIVCLRDFFDKNRENSVIKSGEKYIIPYYQRPYEWGCNDKQLGGMINTFVSFTKEDKENDDGPNCILKKSNDEYVVFGTIQINKNNGLEIIDGQQRLTSFWIFLKAIENYVDDQNELNENLEFEIENQISEDYKKQFNSFSNLDNEDKKENIYASNYNWLYDRLRDIGDKKQVKELKTYLLNNVVFSLMMTQYEDNVEKTIGLFNSLNTTGLDLGMKDVFKIKYFEFNKNINNKNKANPVYRSEASKGIFDIINSSYEKCYSNDLLPMYKRGEDALIDTFKLWILMKDSKYQKNLAKKLRATNNRFFIEKIYSVWDETYNGDEDVRSLKTFSDLSESIYQTQKILQRLDENPKDNKYGLNNYILLSSDELLKNCGYWYFRNLFYVFTHAIRMEKNNPEERNLVDRDVAKALTLCQIVWKICSVAKIWDTRVRDYFFNKIAQEIIFKFVENPNIDIKTLNYTSILSDEYKSRFKELLFDVGGDEIYGNRQCWFFTAISYLIDIKEDSGFRKHRELIFYPDKKEKFEIEHIASSAVCKGEIASRYKNRLGNLLFLNNGVNSYLGKQTAKIKKQVDDNIIDETKAAIEDFCGKICNNDRNKRNYVTEKDNNPAIESFLKSISSDYNDGTKEIGIKEIGEIIKSRDENIIKYIKNLYNDIIEFEK